MQADKDSDPGHRPDKRLLVFVHIPKTAGTTLNSLLEHRYSPDETYEVMMRGMSLIMRDGTNAAKPLISWSKLRRFKSALRHRHELRLVRGHFDLSLAPLLPADAQYITLLRDPVQRAISHYFHYRRRSTDPEYALAMRSSLAEWVSACGLVEMDNGQTRRLAGAMHLPVGRVSDATLETAKAALADKFAVVGLTERFEETQILLQRRFGWPRCRYPSCNRGGDQASRTEIDAQALQIVRDCNRYDLELYRHASMLFEQSAGAIDMERELHLLRAAPLHIAPAPAAPAPALPGRVHVLNGLRYLYPMAALHYYAGKLVHRFSPQK